MSISELQDVAVLLAAYNGADYIKNQLASIANQKFCIPYVFVSDDGSTDETLNTLLETCSQLSLNCELITKGKDPLLSARNSANNFYHLILNTDLPESINWVAFSDQDDIWFPHHLSRALQRFSANSEIGGYSSSVVAFWENGRTRLIRKSGYVGPCNHLFESPGPGCSIVLPKNVFYKLKTVLANHLSVAATIDFHDWLIYAVVKSFGYEWFIDSEPSLLYRQHNNNVLGVGIGFCSLWKRFDMVYGWWYRKQCLNIATICDQQSFFPIRMLSRLSILDRIGLILYAPFLRRRSRDRLALSIGFLFMH